ncbi:uncharacterized protein LOC130649276 isoform X2 [Hydractinia symbiolongicarpus]|uniref:uncharacterized protein LOC130649276 isoform X2 n=1 Tax=Hydractinia symbiolongicarpus TaxID=13093 RepID=UPI00254DC3EB|nr:uncharacterized protein LOC130649276 isoform X2 [Hydractinia symbiolongicarpus]
MHHYPLEFHKMKQTAAMAETRIPKPAPKSRYGPSFDEIERRDPVQWHTAHQAWVKERVVEQEMVKIYKERMSECYQREQENFPQLCRKQILDYWNAFQAWKKKDWGVTEEGSVYRFKVPIEEYYREVEALYDEK